MDPELSEIRKKLVLIQKSVAGVKEALAYPPESIPNTPCFLNFIGDSDDIVRNPSERIVPHRLRMVVLVARPDLPTAEEKLEPLIGATLDAFDHNITLGGLVVDSRIARYQRVNTEWGKTPYVGIEFLLEVRPKEAFEFS